MPVTPLALGYMPEVMPPLVGTYEVGHLQSQLRSLLVMLDTLSRIGIVRHVHIIELLS